jgi:hypothetical protein
MTATVDADCLYEPVDAQAAQHCAKAEHEVHPACVFSAGAREDDELEAPLREQQRPGPERLQIPKFEQRALNRLSRGVRL